MDLGISGTKKVEIEFFEFYLLIVLLNKYNCMKWSVHIVMYSQLFSYLYLIILHYLQTVV